MKMPKPGFLIDTNILIDITTRDPVWYGWSADQIRRAARSGQLYINAIIFSEFSAAYPSPAAAQAAVPESVFARAPLDDETAFIAGQAFRNYRLAGGARGMILPDFLIGAQASAQEMTLITRDRQIYKKYFPHIQLITPEKQP